MTVDGILMSTDPEIQHLPSEGDAACAARGGGRPREGLAMIDRLGGGTREGRRRLSVILQTLSGELSIDEACEVLEIGRSRFHEIRSDFLRRAPEILEPGVPGPSPRVAAPELAALRREVVELREDKMMAELREELLLMTMEDRAAADLVDREKRSTRCNAKKEGVKRRPRKAGRGAKRERGR